MCSRLVCEQRELCHDRHTVSLLTDHIVISPKYRGKILVEKTIALALDGIIHKTCARRFHISGNSAIKVSGHHPVSMDRSVMGGRLWRDAYGIRRSQMRNRHVQTPYLSPGFSDLHDISPMLRLMHL